jgi:hypothetical protein
MILFNQRVALCGWLRLHPICLCLCKSPRSSPTAYQVLEKEGPLLRRQANQDGIRSIARSIATCLGCFHACNIVHGDVKVKSSSAAPMYTACCDM